MIVGAISSVPGIPMCWVKKISHHMRYMQNKCVIFFCMWGGVAGALHCADWVQLASQLYNLTHINMHVIYGSRYDEDFFLLKYKIVFQFIRCPGSLESNPWLPSLHDQKASSQCRHMHNTNSN